MELLPPHTFLPPRHGLTPAADSQDAARAGGRDRRQVSRKPKDDARLRFADGRRHFDVWMRSERLALSGRVDQLVETPDAAYPVDFKYTRMGVTDGHIIQLAAYAMLAEEVFARPAPAGFIYFIPKAQAVRVAIGAKEKRAVLRAMAEIRLSFGRETLPGPTPWRARCRGCEFQNFCGDIW